MPEFKDLPPEFYCPYQKSCPYLEGLSTSWVFGRYQDAAGLECTYEHQLEELYRQLDEQGKVCQQLERQNQQLRAQLQALHRRQFKGRKAPPTPALNGSSEQGKKRGAPVGHPPWRRPPPKHIDQVIPVPAPQRCVICHGPLQPGHQMHQHVQEDIVLEPRTIAICYVHQEGYCPGCDRSCLQPGPGELLGSYIGPAAKAMAIYLRYEFNVSDRKLSQFFEDFFGLKFVAASAYGFERQAVRRGQPLYADLLGKVRALSVAHADETSWRHAGQNYWVWYAGNNDLAAYLWNAHRSTEAAQKLLGARFDGVLVADAFASYNGVQPKDRQSCLSHIKTRAKELEQELSWLKGAAADRRARRFCQQVQGFVHDACQAHSALSQGPWRRQRAKTLERKLKKQLRQLCRSPLRYPKAEQLRQRLLGPEQRQLFTCFRRPNVPPTNNQAERSLRPVVIMRKVIQGTRSEKGLENHSVLRSLFETSRRQGKTPQDFFLVLFTKDTAQAQAALYRQPLPKSVAPPVRRC